MSDFKDILIRTLDQFEIELDETALDRLCQYRELLIEWNEKINLTALTAPENIALKHFADSLLLLRYIDIEKGARVIDVGTGAGFPGVVLKIARPDISLTLLDSLNKRLTFLDIVCSELGLSGVELIHSRAEDGSRTKLRDSFDIAVSRAVASLNTLCEYDMPYVKVGGRFIAMKGKGADEELDSAQNAITTLGGEMQAKHDFILGEAGERSIIEIKKIARTPDAYPRKSKAIKNKPL
nr:16S rRNA (guanine(527)-N(7))-methyltransferase RsmG [uncultured Ruminococcus sp.]